MAPADESRYVSATVTARRDLTPELWTMRVRPAEPVRFVPGQYVAIGLPAGGKMIERPYSIVSAPGEEEMEFFLELVSGGALTPRLYDVPVGGLVYLRRAAHGRFVFDAARPRHLMVASVTGVAPYVSMLRDLVRRGDGAPERAIVLHSASVPAELGYADELIELAGRCPWLEYTPTISRVWLAPDWPYERGRAEDVARKYADGAGLAPENAIVYACGNPQMVRNIHGAMERAGFDSKALREEQFWPPARK